MPSEQIFFHKGLTYDRRSSLQEPGYLKTADNVIFERDGITEKRPPFSAVNSTATGAIHSIKAWKSKIFIGDTTHIRANSGTGDFTDLYSGFTFAIWQLKAYKDFLIGANGTNFALFDSLFNTYNAQVANPTTAATLADSGSGGNPDGVYIGYVSYFITWPNGHTYETGLSAASSDVTVATNQISWTDIPICPYAALYGTAPTIYRNLYRGPGTGGTLTEIYYVTTIADNTTTTYTDNVSDATLQTGYVCTCEDYLPMIVPKYFDIHYGRIFGVHPTYTNRLYWSEVAVGETATANELLFPLSYLEDNWDDIRVPGFDVVDPQGLITYGSYLYIPLKHTWIRKQGNDPSTWAYRKTYATMGIGSPHTIDVFPQGIIGLTNAECGEACLAIFNGSTSERIASPKLDYLFKTDLDLDYTQNARGARVGKYYYLIYQSIATSAYAMIVLDMSRGMGDIRISEWTDMNGNSLDTDTQGTKVYIGGSNGIVYVKAATGAVDVEIETHDLIGDPKLANQQKTYNELKYALNTNGSSATLYLYIDDTLQTWPDGTTSKTISGTSEATQVLNSLPQNWKGKRLRLKVTLDDATTFELYSPWTIDFTV